MQRRILSIVGAAILGCGIGFGAEATPPSTSPEKKSAPAENLVDEPALVEAHNRARAEEKLGPLTANPKLRAAALVQARDMALHDKLTHEGSDGSTPTQRIEREGYHFLSLAENVAVGAKTTTEVMQLWMDSPPHRKNLLGDFTEIGVACVKSKDETRYWAVTFGKPMPRLDPNQAAAEVVSQLNRAREELKKEPLNAAPKLGAIARRHAEDDAAHDQFRPKDDDGLTLFDRVERSGYRSKQIGAGSLKGYPTAEAVVHAWLEQPSLRKNLLDGSITDVGIGYGLTEKGIPYWCLIYAEPRR